MTGGFVALPAEARQTARRLLEPTGDRWRHTVGVAQRAAELAERLRLDTDLLVAAAWLHDIGYAEAAAGTGFHPLDGARYLAEQAWPRRIVCLVAQHSGARYVAAAQGLTVALGDYPDEGGLMADALTYADQTVGPRGERLDWRQRHAEMLRRRGPDSWNARVDHLRWPYLAAAAARVERHLATATVLEDA